VPENESELQTRELIRIRWMRILVCCPACRTGAVWRWDLGMQAWSNLAQGLQVQTLKPGPAWKAKRPNCWCSSTREDH